MRKHGWKYIVGFFFFQVTSAQNRTMSDAAIWRKIERFSPLKGAVIPADFSRRLGATHVGGKYFFTNEPYLVEGTKKLKELGMGVCKLWMYKNPSGYQYNSDWNLPKNTSLTDLAKHPYYQAAFAFPLSTFVLSTSAGVNMIQADSAGLAKEEKEFYDLALYLLEKYQDRDVEFILSNWEGDWILRGGVGWEAQWGRVAPPDDLPSRIQSLRRVFEVRQRAVDNARKKIPQSRCRVYHAIEVNKVVDASFGIPSVTNDVLPFVHVDMVSWSAYDATDFDKTGIDLYRGIDYIRSKMKPSEYTKKPIVFIGEIGIPEMATKNLPEEFKHRWDTYLSVCLAQQIPYIIYWELYCNETGKDVKIEQPASTKNNRDLNGFWLIRPDGKQGYAMNYFEQLLQNAGRRLAVKSNE